MEFVINKVDDSINSIERLFLNNFDTSKNAYILLNECSLLFGLQ